MQKPTTNTNDANDAGTQSAGENLNERPSKVPGIFRFERSFSGSYVAEMEPKLLKRYKLLGGKAQPTERSLAWALDMATKVRPKDLDDLVLKNGYMLFGDMDANGVSEFGTLNSNSRLNQVHVMAQCCRIVLEIQRAIGTDSEGPIGESITEANRDATMKCLAKTMRGTTTLLQKTKKLHESALYVVVMHANGISETMSLYRRAIQIALDLATALQRAPVKLEIRQELVRQYAHLKKKPKSFWSKLYRDAGLTGLNQAISWTETRQKQQRLEDLKRKGITH